MLFVCIVFKIVIAPLEHLDTFPHFCVLIFDWSSGQGRGSALGRIRGVAEAVDLEEGVDGEEAVVRRYLQKILMLSWRSITQRQCRSIDEIPCVYDLAFYTLCYINCVLDQERTPTSLCISIIQLFRLTRKKRTTGNR